VSIATYEKLILTYAWSGQIVWSSFEYRKERYRKNWIWWNDKRVCFDKGAESVVASSMLCYL